MSICLKGVDSRLESACVSISVSADHPLIKLANALPWVAMSELVMSDLKKTTCGLWWLGRKLRLRPHLAVFFLQARLQAKDREIEEMIRHNAVYQVFCGCFIVPRWHCPDHTAIIRFRNRLSPETQRQLLVLLIKTADSLGYADPNWMDVDSTVQEANMAYPSDANLMHKMAKAAGKVADWLKKNNRGLLPKGFAVDVRMVAAKAKEYFFLAKNVAAPRKRQVFRELHRLVARQLGPLIGVLKDCHPRHIDAMPLNIRRWSESLAKDGSRYLLDVAHFIRTHTVKRGKLLSFQLKEVACIVKGKLGKSHEFGRVFQLGRVGGNFLIPLACTEVRQDDRKSFLPMIREHATIFGAGLLCSVGADKGYYSATNARRAFQLGISEVGLQKPGKLKEKRSPVQEARAKQLKARRAGIEALIGHAKKCGLARSRMNSDSTTLASGYRSVLSFNLRQFERHQNGMMKKRTDRRRA
jgi:IS5 family transposase